ncbi:MAG: hypothetical protein QM753_12070 [Thermomicrobiales bacterium]
MVHVRIDIADPGSIPQTSPDYTRMLRAREATFAACTRYHALRAGPVIAAIAPYVTFGPDGEADNIDALVRELRTGRPGWFRQDQTATDLGPWTGPRKETSR